jgi:lipopolysaccharide export system protein LptA
MRRRGLEFLLVGFGAVFLGVVALSFRGGSRLRSRGAPAAARVPSPRDAGPPTSFSSGFDFTESVSGKPLFRIQAKATAGFGGTAAAAGAGPDVYAGEGVTLTLYPENGQPVTVESDRAEYDSRSRDAALSGNVRWRDEKGGLAETSKVLFRPAARALDIPASLHFSRAGFDLAAKSGRFDVAQKVLSLDGPIDGSGEASGRGPLSTLHAAAGTYRKDEGLVELTGGVTATSGQGDAIASDRLLLKTEDPGGRLAWARALGNVHGVVGAGRLPGAKGAGRPYAGDEGAFFFDADGALTSLTLTGAPASAEEPDRKVTAKTIEIAFANGRAVTAKARGQVEILSEGQTASADAGDLSFGNDGQVSGVSLTGRARLRGEGRSGSAERAVQVAERDTWVLTGDDRASAMVEQDGSKVSAPRIEIDDRTKLVRAEGGGVRAVLAPARGDRANATLVGDPSKPTFGKSDRMVFDRNARTATLSGGAALWQGDSSLFGRDITLNDTERSVVATGQARAVLAPDAAAKRPGQRTPTVLLANRLVYREKPKSGDAPGTGEVSLDGGVTAIQGGRRANARAGAVTLGADRRVQKVDLRGDVRLADTGAGRSGEAEHAVDFPEEGRTVLEGSPARVTDRDGSRVAGAILTITDQGRRVEITAPLGGETQTIHPTRPDR